MQFLICEKHCRKQKASHKVTTNSFICMNRYCGQSFVNMCALCKNEHRDHANKVLTLEDITFLIQRLLKSPFKQLTQYVDEAVTAMKKFKLIQENKRKIQMLQKEIYREVIGLVEFTESLIHEYALCKKKITQLSDILINIQTPEAFSQFSKNSVQFLANLDYNFQKDKFEYGNQIIKQKYQNRRKAYEKTKRRLEQIKDYSMKIIEVILANQESEEQEQDIIYKKKMYEILKRELEDANNNLNTSQKDISSNNNNINKEKQLYLGVNHSRNIDQVQNEHSAPNDNSKTGQKSQNGNYSIYSEDKRSKSTAPPGIFFSKSQSVLSIQKSSQTSSQWIKAIQQSAKQYELKIKKIQQTNAKSLNQLQHKISMLVKEKDSAKKEFSMLQQKQKLKNQKILQIEAKLRENKRKRQEKQKLREAKLQKLIDIANWRSILQGDRID